MRKFRLKIEQSKDINIRIFLFITALSEALNYLLSLS